MDEKDASVHVDTDNLFHTDNVTNSAHDGTDRFDLEQIMRKFMQANEVHQATFVGQQGFLTNWYGTNIVYPMSLALPDFPAFQAREGDVVIAGVAKSGASRFCAITGSMLHADNPQWIYEAPDLQQKVPWLDFCTALNREGPRGLEQVSEMPSPRAFWTRVCYDGLPETCQTKAKIVYHIRHPKDTLVTLYHHYLARQKFTRFSGSLSDLVDALIKDDITSGPWFKHIASYGQHHGDNLFIASFEEFSLDPVNSIKKLASFLEISLTKTEINRIAYDCHFDQMRSNPHCNHSKNAAAGEVKTISNVLPIMRSGKIGGWRQHFTREDNQKVNQWMFENLLNPDVTEIARLFPGTFAIEEL